MAIFRSPVNEKDEINNGWLQELLSLAPRVSRAPTSPFYRLPSRLFTKELQVQLINLCCANCINSDTGIFSLV